MLIRNVLYHFLQREILFQQIHNFVLLVKKYAINYLKQNTTKHISKRKFSLYENEFRIIFYYYFLISVLN